MRLKPFILFTFVVLLSACQSTQVVVDYDTTTNFNSYKRFSWQESTSGAEEGFDPLMSSRVKEAVNRELLRATFTLATPTQQPDVLVRYYVGTYARSEESNTRGSIGLGSVGSRTAVGISLSLPLGQSKVVKEAQIMVDLIGTEDNKLKWRGTNRIKISDQTPDEITALINAAVAEIFSQYPPIAS